VNLLSFLFFSDLFFSWLMTRALTRHFEGRVESGSLKKSSFTNPKRLLEGVFE
jgi:hypothetical protein